MIYPTEMTIVTGTTVYSGDPESDEKGRNNERIASREVRVSVTFQVDEQEDFDIVAFARSKAAEVEEARLAAQERIAILGRTGRGRTGGEDPPFDPSGPGLEPPDDEEEHGDDRSDEGERDGGGPAPAPFPQEADYLSAPCGRAWKPGRPENGGHARNGADSVPRGGNESFPPGPSGAETDWATKPQVLALGSHFKRLGIVPADQSTLLRARFGKFRAERLTRAEAASLMRYLERGEWEPAGSVTAAHCPQ